MATLTCNLPEELLVEILSRLAPESLMRLKCASKSWYVFIKNLVKDPKFVAKHLQNSMSSTYMIFSGNHYCDCNVRTPKCSEVMFSLLDVFCGDNADGQICVVTEDLSSLRIPINSYLSEYVWRYHCNGIFCLVDSCNYAYAIILCNPAINEFKLLPKPSHVCRSPGVGFGYDSGTNDYKVVVFGYDNLKRFTAEVYSLNTHSWREIVFGLDVDCMPDSPTTVYLKGVFYWLSWKRIILSFDMCSEVRHSILMPGDGGSPSASVWTSLTLWNESVTLIYSSKGDFYGGGGLLVPTD
ncbi:hypothetical protein TIFTF001_030663 [Ficus carica]|uniref:F-box domain-containing protein n=1 Tax=Ficus carica TaxID=3494 RepID=A0AA88J023_FICCA|nr:hypothetical protein TIFTF001_030663 [Ficus carica]